MVDAAALTRSAGAHRTAFTLFEVMATAMLIGTGLMALIAVIMFAMSRAMAAQAACTAMPTAVSAAYDPAPLLPAETAGEWTTATISAAGTGAEKEVSSGWMNGYWVVRRESCIAADTLGEWTPSGASTTWSIASGKMRSIRVEVHVYDGGSKGREVASFVTRILRQGTP